MRYLDSVEFYREDRHSFSTRRPQRYESYGRVHSTLLGEVSVKIQNNCAKVLIVYLKIYPKIKKVPVIPNEREARSVWTSGVRARAWEPRRNEKKSYYLNLKTKDK